MLFKNRKEGASEHQSFFFRNIPVLPSVRNEHVGNYQQSKNSVEHGRNLRDGPARFRAGVDDPPRSACHLRKIVGVIFLHFARDVRCRG